MTLPSFSEFFTAVHGFAPFPWQQRLAQNVLSAGWPDLLDLPTGVGKTTALDVALFALAVAPDRMPRRVLLVVDRRIVVDQGADHARGMLALMRRHDAPASARAIADRLRELWNGSADDDPFAIATLRGGMPRDNDWACRPDQPVLGVSTVDQVGSRLLFRGYGLSSSAWPIQAGLMGNDTLILLDEVHLAVPFAQTLSAIRHRFRRTVHGVPDRFAVVRMSATAGTPSAETQVFTLDDADRRHAVLAQRLSATKSARLDVVKVRGEDEDEKRAVLAAAAVEAARALQVGGAPVVAIVVNRVDTARLAWRLLSAEHRHATATCLVTGRMRPIDRDRVVREHLIPSSGAGRSRADARPMIVVATQCIEAGADLDFDGMVTECASLDALRQRFGRLDRRGERGKSDAVILVRSDDIADEDDAVYGKALSETWTWLQANARDGRIDFGVSALPDAVDEERSPLTNVLAPMLDAPILLPAHLDAWSQTSPRPVQDPDVALWLHGPQRASADVQIVWRAELDRSTDRDDLIAALSAIRPSTLEAITLPLYAARAWFEGRAAVVADVSVTEEVPRAGRRNSIAVPVFRWTGADSDWVSSAMLRPGDTVIVPASRGGIAASNFDPAAVDPVSDLGDLANLRGRGVASLRIAAPWIDAWGLDANMRELSPIDEETPAANRERLRDWFATWPESPPSSFPGTTQEWSLARRVLRGMRRSPILVGQYYVATVPIPRKERPPVELDDLVTEDDDSSFRDGELGLRKHSTDVRGLAEQFAKSLGFGPTVVADIARAGWLHDVGKADPRFQRWLRGGSDICTAEPLAKSALAEGNLRERELARQRAGYPKGYRHELLSLKMVEDNVAALDGVTDRDLVLHLVASHHGWCRPFAPAVDDVEDIATQVTHGDIELAATTRHRLARLDSGVSDRYWALIERYGWWGLAWLEAIVRLADHRASEARELQ